MDRDDLVLAYVQNKLTDADKSAFEEALRQDPDMAAEVGAMRAMRDEFAQEVEQIDPSKGWGRLEATLDAGRPANVNAPLRLSLWQAGGLIAASLALWQVAVVPMTRAPNEPGYEAVSEAADGPVLQVMFSNTADMATVTALLREVNGTIVDGPSAVGLYRIAFTSPQDLEAASEALGARTDVFDMVAVE